jgi:hypothetical protein
MQMVNDQRCQEMHVLIARERLGTVTALSPGHREIPHFPTRRIIATSVAAWPKVLASMTFTIRAMPRVLR